MEIPGNMQAALVSYYGEKTGSLSELIRSCQDQLCGLLLSRFRPYELEQIHGTIIGLEGRRVGDSIRNENFQLYRQEERFMSPIHLLEFLRSEEFPSFNIRVGGYRKDEQYGIVSQNKHPYLRSFSIQNEIAVAMGWPFDGDCYPNTLDTLRHDFNRLNVLHKWHRSQGAVDNDFYFVLGRVDRRFLNDIEVKNAEVEMQRFMTDLNPLNIPIEKSVLSIIGYLDTQAPVQTSCSFRITDPALDSRRLLDLYPLFEA